MNSRILTGALAAAIAGAVILLPGAASAFTDPCGVDSNPIVCENSKPGLDVEDWYSPSAWGPIEGFTTKTSVLPGETVQLKVKSSQPFNVSFLRLGYYNGDGARKMPTSPTTLFPANNQSPCLSGSGTGLVDCGNWTTNVTWAVPSTAVSGIYLAIMDIPGGAGYMPYPFVVRETDGNSDIVVQTSDQTWQAYNAYGGQSLYIGGGPAPDGRAYKVSYNRPLEIALDNGVFASEFPMLQWLERNGYDVSYVSGIDVATIPSLLMNHDVYISSGHDEYWTQSQWDNVTAAREAGVNLAFFSGNEVFWRTRLEPSIASGAAANRTLVCYKETKLSDSPPNGVPDPSGQWTGTWMDPNGAGTGGYKPQNQLTGTLFRVNGYRSDAMTVPAAYKNLRLWRNTSITSLGSGQVATFPSGTLGYEWDLSPEDSFRPPGAVDFSSTTITITDGTLLLDNGNNYGNGVATHSIVMYRDESSDALVFGAGTVQWSWGLSGFHTQAESTPDVRMQQATVNLLADMGVQPLTRQSNLVAATQSADTSGPTVTVNAPSSGATVPMLTPVTVSGTAAEVGGGQLARVEYSVDGGTTWAKANGLASWSFTWIPQATGSATLKVRGIDDSLNIGATSNRTVTVGPQQCPCTVFPPNTTPAVVDSGDGSAVELGAKFRSSAAGTVTGVKFYKSAANTGTHLGRIWSTGGSLLASGPFTNETASGWQTLTLASPLPIAANTTYVVSYYAPNGRYSVNGGFFAGSSAGAAITELRSGIDGPNGVFRYATGGGFPNESWNDSNYWVDVIVDTVGVPTTPPTVTAKTPASGATGVGTNTAVTATFSADINPASLAFTLTPAGGSAVAGTVSYNGANLKATVQPNNALSPSTTYTASVQATDSWGNAMTSPHTWSFTTGAAPTCPCSLWSEVATPGNVNANDFSSVELGTKFSSSVAGQVLGVKFYKGSADTGTHTGSLWTDTGVLVATGTFTNETASGWQTMLFATPVSISAGTTYVVSYHAPGGRYSYNSGYFNNAVSSHPLTGLADAAAGGNGVYKYSGATTFPTETWGASNYWVDVVFTTS